MERQVILTVKYADDVMPLAKEEKLLQEMIDRLKLEDGVEWTCSPHPYLHNEELSDLYSSPNIVRVIKSRRMRWAGHVARMGKERGAYRVLVGKPEGRRPLGRPRRR